MRAHLSSIEPGFKVLVGGNQASDLDFDRTLFDEFPIAIDFLLVITFLLLTIMFRSLLIPLKAVIMNVVSISAALLFLVVTVSFMFTSQLDTKEMGLGMTVAILVDATVIRSLLAPATMRLLGRWNWWFPGSALPPKQAAPVEER